MQFLLIKVKIDQDTDGIDVFIYVLGIKKNYSRKYVVFFTISTFKLWVPKYTHRIVATL